MALRSGEMILSKMMSEAKDDRFLHRKDGILIYINWSKCQALIDELDDWIDPRQSAYIKGLLEARQYLLSRIVICPTCDGEGKCKLEDVEHICGLCEGQKYIVYFPAPLSDSQL